MERMSKKVKHVIMNHGDASPEEKAAVERHLKEVVEPKMDAASEDLTKTIAAAFEKYNDATGSQLMGVSVHYTPDGHLQTDVEGVIAVKREDIAGLNTLH